MNTAQTEDNQVQDSYLETETTRISNPTSQATSANPLANKEAWIVHGVKYREDYDYKGEGIKIRPLSIFEMDEVYATALEDLPCDRTAQAIFNIKEGKIPDLSGLDLATLQRFSNAFNYIAVSMSTEKTLDEILGKPGDFPVHKMAKRILVISGKVKPKEIAVATLRTQRGKAIAGMVCHFYQPLAEIGKMTNLQWEFICEGEKDRKGVLIDATTPFTEAIRRLDRVFTSPSARYTGHTGDRDNNQGSRPAAESSKKCRWSPGGSPT